MYNNENDYFTFCTIKRMTVGDKIKHGKMESSIGKVNQPC